MKQQYILFDLDGTLTDPQEGITRCAAYALEHFDIHVEDLHTLDNFIGPPLLHSFQTYHHLSQEDAYEAIRLYRDRYARIGWLENIPYPGIEDMLRSLTQAGKTLLVATSKPEEFAVQILEHFGLARYFSQICGAPMDEKVHSTKALVIQDALQRGKITDLSDVIMVGDRLHDIEGAHTCGIPAIGILYGYGSREEHENCGADYIAATVAELSHMLQNP